jgi:hypothetical protein
MGKYVARVDVAIDGENISDMKNFKEHELNLRDQVNLMKKTGYVNKTLRHQFSLDYVIPAGARYDFASVEQAACVIAAEDGGAINYAGVCSLKVGEAAYDGEKEVVQTITFGAESRMDT